MPQVFTSLFRLGDRVRIDALSPGAVIGTVIGFCFHSRGTQIQVSWWNNGAVIEQWFDDWRITAADGIDE